MTDEVRSVPKPPPGSQGAIDEGCLCPRLDNNHGHGRPTTAGTQYIVTVGCPLHDERSRR